MAIFETNDLPAYCDSDAPTPELQHGLSAQPNSSGEYYLTVDVGPTFRFPIWVSKQVAAQIRQTGELPAGMQEYAEEQHLRRSHGRAKRAKLFRDGWRRKLGR